MKKIFLAAGLCCMSAIPVSAQKDSNHNFEISKNLEIFNDIYKQLDMFYVDSLSADTVGNRCHVAAGGSFYHVLSGRRNG